MSRPLTPQARHENAAFLKALRRSGNMRLAAREVGVAIGTIHHRRAAHPAFALRITQALVFAHARLRKAGGGHGPMGRGADEEQALRTRGGEPVVVMLKSGLLQVRRAQPGKVTRQAEQAFLLAVAATANISLAAASVGVAEAAFYRRKRRNPAFARELRAALAEGYERLEMALIESWSPASGEDARWQDNDRPALPPMTPAQALQLMHLHHKQVRWRDAVKPGRLLPGETSDLRSARLARRYRARLAEDTENELAAKVIGDAAREGPHAPPPIVLPDLAQVTGWSQADPAKCGHGDAALFGGWRIDDLTPAQRAEGLARAHEATRKSRRRRG